MNLRNFVLNVNECNFLDVKDFSVFINNSKQMYGIQI